MTMKVKNILKKYGVKSIKTTVEEESGEIYYNFLIRDNLIITINDYPDLDVVLDTKTVKLIKKYLETPEIQKIAGLQIFFETEGIYVTKVFHSTDSGDLEIRLIPTKDYAEFGVINVADSNMSKVIKKIIEFVQNIVEIEYADTILELLPAQKNKNNDPYVI